MFDQECVLDEGEGIKSVKGGCVLSEIGIK
jgi:hypothetical protein